MKDVSELPRESRVAGARIIATLQGRVSALDRSALGTGPQQLALSFAYGQVDSMLAEMIEQLLDTSSYPPSAS